MSKQIKSAIELITTFTTGDSKKAKSLLKESYIQHNLNYGTGADAFAGSVDYLGSAPVKTTLKNVRAFEDGNYVFLQNVYNFAGIGEQVAFDIFRFEDGKIAEHWDNLANLEKPNPSGHTQIDGTTKIVDEKKTEQNKQLVKDFVEDILMSKNPNKLTSYFNGNNYIQHNTGIADGLDGLGNALAYYAQNGINMIYNKIHLLLGQGNFVLAVSEGTLGTKENPVKTSYYDLFRVEDGKIAEHWDIMESIKQTNLANNNGKF